MVLRILLLPFAGLYRMITGLRNRLFDLGLKPSVKFDLPVISVGNLVAGGTGKSPMIEHLVRLLSDKYKVATLSRGYGRKTKGLRIGNSLDNASTLGDEPFQFFRKYNDKITVAVGEERALAIPNILHVYPETNVVLMDDAFQHRFVRPSFSILLSDFSKPFYKDYLIPAGRLRESRGGADRADVIVITKCPTQISDDTFMAMESEIRKYTNKRVFYSKIRYGYPVPFGGQQQTKEKVILISGIANPESLVSYVKSGYTLLKHFSFKDHYHYTLKDLEELNQFSKANSEAMLLTTEKDMVKIDTEQFKQLIVQMPLFYLPIETEFLKDGEDFDEMVLSIFNHADDK
ncbi:MAG TPA: tetraacyldisaccharide 4'-kinase [Cyclobacteriaceae bacterium]|jgi:tetraacyldisaccharide 4'-kinase|nr:tetraacyldisaccharide 4'-kinase [Cyclobacteriaceae bacterium]